MSTIVHAPPAQARTAADIAHALLAIEHRLDLQHAAWVDGDVHWWPLYRLELYRLLMIDAVAASKAATGVRRAAGPIFGRVTNPSVDSRGAAWLVSDGISFARVGERDVDRFCDPLHATFESFGRSAVVIDRGSPSPRLDIRTTRWWAPWTQRAKVAGLLLAKLRPDLRHETLVAMVQRAAADAGETLPAIHARRFDAMTQAVKWLAKSVEARLRRDAPPAVFIVCYYDVAGYAYTLAAARVGIPSVDVQHGITGRHHPGYAHWPSREGGWRLLPRWFWCWTQSDAEVVRAWAGDHHHRSVCGGHPFLEAWRSGALQLEGDMKHRLDKLVAASAGRRRVLVTLQPNVTHREGLAPLLSALDTCPNTMWWFRLHPMAHADRAALVNMLAQRASVPHDIDDATALPLPALLRHATLHATHSSSTIVEAQALGVGSVVWSQYGADLAEDAIASSIVRLALDGSSFRAALDGFASAQSGLAPAHQPSPRLAVQTILDTRE